MTYSSEVLADSPLVYWRLGDASGTTMTDSSGNSRDGTYTASPTLGVAGALTGDADTAVTFNGTTQYGTIAAQAWMNPSSVTVECWYKGTDTSGTLVGRGANPANYRIGIASGAAFMEVNSSVGGAQLTSGTTNVADGNWHHIVGVWLSGTSVKIYVDGVLENTLSKGGTLNSASNTLRVAQRNSDSFIAGTIDEAAVYGSDIGATRIAAHFSAAHPPATGTFAATLPTITASFTGTYRDVGTFAATLPKVTASLTGAYAAPPTGTFAATLPVVTASFAGTYTAPATPAGDLAAVLPVVTASFAGDYHPHEAGTFDAVLPVPTADFTGTYTPGLETGTFAATLPILAADFAGTYTSLGETGTFEATLPLVDAALVGTYDGPISTDTSNFRNGRSRQGSATVTITRAVAAPPDTLRLSLKYDKAAAYPTPTMVDGRPT